jgi:hypothetical protein
MNLPFPTCRRAKYELKHVVRTTIANDEEAFKCVYQMEDDQGESSGDGSGFGVG